MSNYKDISFDFSPHPLTGDLQTKTDKFSIIQSVKNLVKTELYKRGFNVDVFSNIEKMVFELNDGFTTQQIRREIREVIESFEPRVSIVEISVSENKEYEVLVTVMFKILNNENVESISVIVERVL